MNENNFPIKKYWQAIKLEQDQWTAIIYRFLRKDIRCNTNV